MPLTGVGRGCRRRRARQGRHTVAVHGLRRAAVGVLRILEDRKWPLDVAWLLKQAVMVQPNDVKGSELEVLRKLSQFMEQRLAAVLEERSFKSDEINAVLSAGIGAVPEALSRLEALHQLRDQPEFVSLAAAFKRATNILRQAEKNGAFAPSKNPAVNPDLLAEPTEKALHEAFLSVQAEARAALDRRSYSEALAVIARLQAPLNDFFQQVMVMAEDSSVKTNRLNLLNSLVQVFYTIADFSKLQNA